MKNPQSPIPNPKFCRRGFTLTELLVVMMVLAILAALTVAALAGAVNDARAARTRTVINKIDQLISERWEGYRTRSVRVVLPSGTPPTAANFALARLLSIRELQRLELPDQISDLCTANERVTDLAGDSDLDAIVAINDVQRALLGIVPSVTIGYKRLAERSIEGDPAVTTDDRPWTTANQGAECLYLILAVMKDGDKSAIDYFSTDEIGDVDGDGMKEILDGWGQPITFFRWPAGYTREQPGADFYCGQANTDDNSNSATDDLLEYMTPGSDDFLWTATEQTRDTSVAPDPFDPLKVDPRWANVDPGSRPYALRPLILSAGPDKSYDIVSNQLDAMDTANGMANDPYSIRTTQPYNRVNPLPGTPQDTDGDGGIAGDNITNHDNTAPGS